MEVIKAEINKMMVPKTNLIVTMIVSYINQSFAFYNLLGRMADGLIIKNGVD